MSSLRNRFGVLGSTNDPGSGEWSTLLAPPLVDRLRVAAIRAHVWEGTLEGLVESLHLDDSVAGLPGYVGFEVDAEADLDGAVADVLGKCLLQSEYRYRGGSRRWCMCGITMRLARSCCASTN